MSGGGHSPFLLLPFRGRRKFLLRVYRFICFMVCETFGDDSGGSGHHHKEQPMDETSRTRGVSGNTSTSMMWALRSGSLQWPTHAAATR